jgi:hypothetical protein
LLATPEGDETMTTRRSVTVFGDPVQVTITQTTDGYECVFDPRRNRGYPRRDVQTSGRGETVEAAVRAYVRRCHLREAMPPGELYGHDTAFRS